MSGAAEQGGWEAEPALLEVEGANFENSRPTLFVSQKYFTGPFLEP